MDIRKAWTLEKHVHTVKNSRENREAAPRPSIFPRNIGKYQALESLPCFLWSCLLCVQENGLLLSFADMLCELTRET